MINKKKIKVFICATEQSGDNIGHNIILHITDKFKNIEFDGVGGKKMSKLLNKQFFSIKDFNKMGIIEILFSIKKYIQMINFLSFKIIKNNYDLIITIDSPDFNYPLVNKISKQKITSKKIQIVAPTVWAWRKNRALQFSKIFDEILILFDFEKKYFKYLDVKTTHIGHPIYYLKKSLKKNNYIAFLFGSRISEIKKLLPYFEIAYSYLNKYYPHIKIFIPTLPHLKDHIVKNIKNWKNEVFISCDDNEIEDKYNQCDKALVCSGTASLEIAKRNIPQLVIYKLNIFTEILAKNFINVKFANLINIVANQMIIPELTNSNLQKDVFISEFKKLIEDDSRNLIQINKVNEILKKFNVNEPPYDLAAKRIISYF